MPLLPLLQPTPYPVASLVVPIHAVQINAARVVSDSEALLTRAQSLRGTLLIVRGGAQSRVEFALQKPGSLLLRSAGKTDLYDGKDHVIVSGKAKTYERRDAALYGVPYLIGFESFLKPKDREITLPAYGAAEVVQADGRAYVRRTTGSGTTAMTIDLDPTTNLPARWSWRANGETIQAIYENVTVDGTIAAGTFDIEAAIAGHTPVPTAEEVALPAIGSPVPTFEAPTLGGKRLDIATFAADKRATVIAFFDPNVRSSADGFARLGELSRRRDLRGIGVVGVSNGTDPETTRKFLSNCRFSPPTFVGADALSARSAFGVRLSPTFLVIGADGTVRARSIGFDERVILAALDAKASD